MPASNDDDLIWDEPKKARRAEPKRTGFRRAEYDVVADLVDDEAGGSGNLLWILAGVGGGVAVLATVIALLLWGREKEPEVVFVPPPVAPPAPVDPPPVPNPVPVPPPVAVPLPPPLPPPAIGVIPRVEDPAPFAQRVQVRVGPRVACDQQPHRMVYSDRHQILVTSTEKEARVYDTKANKVLATLTAKHFFSDLSLTPDESAVMVADDGWESIGHGTQINPHHVHRYTFATGATAVVRVKGIAHRMEALSADRFVLLSADQWTSGTLNHWPATGDMAEEVAKASMGRGGDIEFDPYTGRLVYFGWMPGSSTRFSTVVTDRGFRDRKDNGHGGAGDIGQLVLGTDGRYAYHGRDQFAPENPAVTTRTFPEAIRAASRDVAFGVSGRFFRAHTGTHMDRFEFKPGPIALARDGRTGWVADGVGLRRLDLLEAKGEVVPANPDDPKSDGPWDPPVYAPPANPFAAGAPLTATEVRTFACKWDRVEQLLYSAPHDRLVVRTQTGVHIVNAQTGVEVLAGGGPGYGPNHVTLTPDQSTLYVACGELYRFDLGKGAWSKRAVPGPDGAQAGPVFALSDERVGMVVLNRWQVKPQLAAFRWGRDTLIPSYVKEFEPRGLGWLRYDPATRTLYSLAGLEFGQSPGVRRYALDRGGWTEKDQNPTPLDRKATLDRQPVLAVPGGRLHVGLSVLTADGKVSDGEYAAPVTAAMHDYVLTERGKLRDAVSGADRGDLGRKVGRAVFTADGKAVWVLDEHLQLTRFDLAVGKPAAVVNPGPVAPPAATAGWFPTPQKRPADDAPTGARTKLTATATLPVKGVVPAALRPAEARGLLFVLDVKNEVYVLDTAGGKVVGDPLTDRKFAVPSVAPDQSAAYTLGDGQLFRYDMAGKRWEKKPLVAGQVLGLAADLALVTQDVWDRKTEFRVVRWTDAVAPVVGVRAEFNFKVERMVLNPYTGLLYALTTDLAANEAVVRELAVTGTEVAEKRAFKIGPPNKYSPGNLVLSSDGTRLFSNRSEVAIDRPDAAVLAHPYLLVEAAGRDLVVANGGKLFRADTSQYLGQMPPLVHHSAVNPDGKSMWAFGGSGADRGFRRFTLDADSAPLVRRTRLEQRTVLKTGPVTQVGCLDRAGLVVALEETRLVVLDKKGGEVTARESRAGGVFAVAPDQSAVFLMTDELHRYDVPRREWETARFPVSGKAPTKLAAVGSRTVAVYVPTGAVAVYTVAGGMLTAGSRVAVPESDVSVLANPTSNGLYTVGESKGETVVRWFTLAGDRLSSAGTSAFQAGVFRPWSKAPVVSADGSRLHVGKHAVPTDRKSANVEYPAEIRGAARDVAVGADGRWFDAVLGKPLAAAPPSGPVAAAASSADGKVFWIAPLAGGLIGYDATADTGGPAVTVPPPPKTNPPVAPPPKTNPPVAPPPPKSPPKASGRPPLPYAPGTQTVVKETERFPAAQGVGTRLTAAEPLGLLVILERPRDGFAAYDLQTKKKVAVPQPTADAIADLVSPPDRSAVYVHNRKSLFRLDAARKRWVERELPAGTTLVAAVGADRLVAGSPSLADDVTVLRELKWGDDGKLTVVHEVRVDTVHSALRPLPSGERVLAVGRGRSDGGTRKLHMYSLSDKGPAADWSHQLRLQAGGVTGTVSVSWDGTRAYRQDAIITLDGTKPAEANPPSAQLVAASRDLLFASSGEYFTTTGKAAGKLGHPVRVGDLTPDGRALWALDAEKKEFVRYALTDGK